MFNEDDQLIASQIEDNLSTVSTENARNFYFSLGVGCIINSKPPRLIKLFNEASHIIINQV